jgi:energy-coupling factor transport system permease protein
VNIAPRYLGRGSWLARRDPRVLILVVALFIFTVLQTWDGRLVFAFLVLSVIYYRSAAIPWRQIRRNWAIVLLFVSFIVTVNIVVAGGEVRSLPADRLHVYFHLPLVGTPISAESVALGFTLLLRYLAMATIGFPVAFAIAPSDFGIDLTFRFLPSLAADFQTTVDAQRIRGYDWSAGARGFLGKVRRAGPVVVPTVVNAIAGAEDTIDAMDLRGFGTGRRTWVRQLTFDRTDKLVLLAFGALLAVVTVTGFLHESELWTPQFLIDLAPH